MPKTLDPTDLVNILGKNFVAREHQPIVQINPTVTYDRHRLGQIGCPHIPAALKFQRTILDLRIRTLDGLAREIHTLGNYKGCGVTVYYIALAILRDQGYDPEEVHGEDVTFSTLKTRAMKGARKRTTKRPRRAGPPSEAAEAGA